MAFNLKTFLFSLFPEYYQEKDTYKDSNNQGLLERYLESLGEELDNTTIPALQNFQDLFTVTNTPNNLLPFLGSTLGFPPNLNNDILVYKKVLKYAVAIYKIKGTPASYNLLFNLLNLSCNLTLLPSPNYNLHDNEVLCDTPGTIYDTVCNPCKEYNLTYWNNLDNPAIPSIYSIPQADIDALTKIICWVEPIDCKLKELSHGIRLIEGVQPTIGNDVTIEAYVVNLYDTGLLTDNSISTDSINLTASNNYFF